MTIEPGHELQRLGVIRVASLNQVGESVKYNKRSGNFVLSRAGSDFDLLVHVDSENVLTDFRALPAVTVSLRMNDGYLAFDPDTRQAILEATDGSKKVPPNATFLYQRRKFDQSSASISIRSEGKELWLRHANSKLRV